MKLWRGIMTGMVFGLIAAPTSGALIGGLYGVPLPCEPNWISGGAGLFLGAIMYGMLLFVPTALVGAILGGAVAANRGTGGQGKAEQGAPADRPRD